MKTNVREKVKLTTHEGGVARRQEPVTELRRTMCACLLWEDSFYESGVHIAQRITQLAGKLSPEQVVAEAGYARRVMGIRHAPLLLLKYLAGVPGPYFRNACAVAIQRPDEMGEFLSLYGRKLPSRVKRGLGDCFHRFSEYQLAKYKGDGAKFSLRDVMFLTHPKPRNNEEKELFAKVANKQLSTPDTWEVEISAKGNNRESWERLLREKKLGALALLRNLRNMESVGVDKDLIEAAMEACDASKVFPFRYVAAFRASPSHMALLDKMLAKTIDSLPKIKGKTAILVDVSGSMFGTKVSAKSDMDRADAAAALAACYPGNCDIYSFANNLVKVNTFKGLPAIEKILSSQPHGGTYLGQALRSLPDDYDRVIVITDEQSSDRVVKPRCKVMYVINVASYQPSIVYGDVVSITGFSENVFRFIAENEQNT